MALTDIFRDMSARRQLMLVVAGVLILSVAAVAGYLFFVRTSYATLGSGLKSSEAAAIVSELDRRKVDYRLEDGGSTILVPKEALDATRLAVSNADLPLKGMVGFELFNKSDLGLTDFEQKINYQRALQGELARTIMTLASIESARVHLTLAEATIFKADRIPSKASVTVATRTGQTLTGAEVHGIQRLVAAAVPDLDSADVVVLDERGQVISSETMAASTPEMPRRQAQRAAEAYFARAIEQALSSSLPGSRIDVRVRALADPGPDGAMTDFAIPTEDATRREYGLAVTLIPHHTLSAGEQGDVRAIVDATIATDPVRGDLVSFAQASTLGAPQALSPSGPASAPPAADVVVATGSSLPWQWLGGAVLAILGLGLVAALLLRFRAERRIPQRDVLVRRFNDLLDQVEADAGPRH
jgi:flagellar M-ring protein FliF